LTAYSDRRDKAKLLYPAAGALALGLFLMYLFRFGGKTVLLLTFGIAGLLMITGYIFVSALCGALVRDYTPAGDAGKLQGIRMIFSVLIPMLIGPMIGNAINKAANIPLPDLGSADVMTTEYIPAPGIFLAAAVAAVAVLALIPLLKQVQKKQKEQ
jgi:MFS family permease